ncbi:ATP-binding protein [Spirillospora sp. NPDC029432]|uniref:ATP-binding protein n=1 Tax=Spirillospora sp. NPDC029432 TaxID=3154599 RepID=UPI0034518C82
MTASHEPPHRRTARWRLPHAPASAADARALTARTLTGWNAGTPEDRDDVVLMVDELVTNAVVHGRGPVRLRLRLDGTLLTAEVADDDPAAPTPPGRGPDLLDWAENGRGLLLVGSLASAFGTRPEGPGKTVWFTRLLHHPAPAKIPAQAAAQTAPPGQASPPGRPVPAPHHTAAAPPADPETITAP